MKKLLAAFLMILTVIGTMPFHNVKAIDCTGNRFSVDQILSQTQLENFGCFALTDYSGAIALFNQKTTTDNMSNVIITYFGDNPNTSTVIETDYSKIIVADRAMAYSQGLVYTNASTMNIYGDVGLSTSYTYMDDRNQLYYYGTFLRGTPATVTPANLTAEISVNGAHGYVKLNQIQLIPLIYVENGWTYNIDITGGVKTLAVKQAYYQVAVTTKNTINGSITFKQLKIYTNYVSSAMSSYEIGVAPDWLPIGTYYSPDGIHFYTDVDLRNPVYNGTTIGKFYNYYAFTNMRSKTNYTGADLDTYITYYQTVNNQNPAASTMTGAGAYFVNAQNAYGMNALMIYSMGALESGFGRSTYAQNPANLNGLVVKDAVTLALLPYTVAEFCVTYPSGKYADENNVIHYCLGRYNLFGWGAYDSDPNNAQAFASIEACVTEHMGINLRRSYMNYNGSTFYGSDLGNKGAGFNTKYASDPWWSIGISAIAYQIDRYLGFKDLNSLQLGILDPSVSSMVYKDSALSVPFYSIKTRALNYSFIILEGLMVNGNLVYKIQTTNPINEDGSINVNPDAVLVPFDFSKSIGYIDADQIGTYISKFVTGVTDKGLYNTDRQIFFTSGTATINGNPITSGATVSDEGVYNVVATSETGIVQTLQFTIDKTSPIISVNNYSTLPTNQDLTVTATVNEGQLDVSAYTFTENGSYIFRAVDNAGNIAEKTVEITNIDKVAPIITIGDFDAVSITSFDITVSAFTNEGSLNEDQHLFARNGSFDFIATDAAGNVTTKTVTVSNIVKSVVLTYTTLLIGGSLSAELNDTLINSGTTITSIDQVVFTVDLLPKYHVYRWLFNDQFLSTRASTINLDYPYLDTYVNVEFYIEGDLNSDGKVSTTDIVLMRRYIAGLDSSNEKAVLAADINGDGKVSTTDLVKIRRILAGLE